MFYSSKCKIQHECLWRNPSSKKSFQFISYSQAVSILISTSNNLNPYKEKKKKDYRTRANNGRSRLVAAPLSSQAKMHFLLAFYVTI